MKDWRAWYNGVLVAGLGVSVGVVLEDAWVHAERKRKRISIVIIIYNKEFINHKEFLILKKRNNRYYWYR